MRVETADWKGPFECRMREFIAMCVTGLSPTPRTLYKYFPSQKWWKCRERRRWQVAAVQTGGEDVSILSLTRPRGVDVTWRNNVRKGNNKKIITKEWVVTMTL